MYPLAWMLPTLYMPMFYVDYYYLILVIPAMIFALITQARVKSTYRRFSSTRNRRGLTGADAAMEVLRRYQIFDVRIERVAGELTDHYDPRTKVIRLSDGVYGSTSLAAIGIACHEAGHAAQHAEKYVPIKIRNAIIPICNIGSSLGIPLALIGLIFAWKPIFFAGIILFAAVAVFQFVTLPVEFNASARALRVIDESGLLEEEEQGAAKKVLRAAAMTYVAALATSLASLLRLLLLFNNRRSR